MVAGYRPCIKISETIAHLIRRTALSEKWNRPHFFIDEEGVA